jgi:hypothetical protein
MADLLLARQEHRLIRRQKKRMSIHEYLMKACQDDALRAGERDRQLLEARRARNAGRNQQEAAAPAATIVQVRRLTRLMFRRATKPTAQPAKPASSEP